MSQRNMDFSAHDFCISARLGTSAWLMDFCIILFVSSCSSLRGSTRSKIHLAPGPLYDLLTMHQRSCPAHIRWTMLDLILHHSEPEEVALVVDHLNLNVTDSCRGAATQGLASTQTLKDPGWARKTSSRHDRNLHFTDNTCGSQWTIHGRIASNEVWKCNSP